MEQVLRDSRTHWGLYRQVEKETQGPRPALMGWGGGGGEDVRDGEHLLFWDKPQRKFGCF